MREIRLSNMMVPSDKLKKEYDDLAQIAVLKKLSPIEWRLIEEAIRSIPVDKWIFYDVSKLTTKTLELLIIFFNCKVKAERQRIRIFQNELGMSFVKIKRNSRQA